MPRACHLANRVGDNFRDIQFMTNAEILDQKGFRETPDERWRYNIALHKAFNFETQRDATIQQVQRWLAEPVLDGTFNFYFWTRGSDDIVACKALLNQLRSNDMVVVKYAPR